MEIVSKSSRDVTATLKEHEIQQAQTTKDETEYEIYKGAQNSHGDLLPNVKAYKLFDWVNTDWLLLHIRHGSKSSNSIENNLLIYTTTLFFVFTSTIIRLF